MGKNIYVATNPELGWNCVEGVYKAKSEKDVYKCIAKKMGVDENDETLRNITVVHQKHDIIEL